MMIMSTNMVVHLLIIRYSEILRVLGIPTLTEDM